MENKKKWDIAGSIIMIAIFLSGFYIYSTIANDYKKNNQPPQIIEKTVAIQVPDCPQTFTDYQALEKRQSVELIHNFHAYAAGGGFIKDNQNISLVKTGNDEIACGYLYVKAVKDHKKIDNIDHIYINPNGFGGHIVSSNSITLDHTPPDNTIEFVLPLDAITYLQDKRPYRPNAQDNRIANWVKMLNVSNQTTFAINSAIQNDEAIIEEVRIAYKCWNPSDIENNQKETNNCQLGVQ